MLAFLRKSRSSERRARIRVNRKGQTKNRKSEDYKPMLLRWPTFALLGVYLCCLFVILEYGFWTITVAESRRHVPTTPLDEEEFYGPFVSRPILAVVQPTETASSPSRSNRESIPLKTSSPTPTPTPRPPYPSNGTAIYVPDAWSGLPVTTRTIDFRPGIPGLGRPYVSPNSTAANSTGVYRRVPPSNKYGQLSGSRMAVYMMLSETSRTIYVYLLFLPEYQLADIACCAIVCDGPAMVFLEPKCWARWTTMSDRINSLRLANDGRPIELYELGMEDANPCQRPLPTSVKPDIVTATLYDEAPTTIPVSLSGKDVLFTETRTLGDGTRTPFSTYMRTGIHRPTFIEIVLHDENGLPTATSMLMKTLTDWRISTALNRGNPTTTLTTTFSKTQAIWTIVDANGEPIRTLTTYDYPGFVQTITQYDKDRRPTATTTVTNPAYGRINYVTITDSNGVPVATITPEPIPFPGFSRPTVEGDEKAAGIHPVSGGSYFFAAFLPVLITLPLTVLAQMINSHIKALLPFHALTRKPNGAPAAESLWLNTGGVIGYFTSWHLLFTRKEPLLFMSQVLALSSAGVVSFASEAFSIVLYGSCAVDDFNGCHMGVAVFRVPGRIVQAFLLLDVVAVIYMGFLLRRWRSGILEPKGRSIAGVASLLSDKDTRKVLQGIKVDVEAGETVGRKEMVRDLEGYSFVSNRDSWFSEESPSNTATSEEATTKPPLLQIPIPAPELSETNPSTMNNAPPPLAPEPEITPVEATRPLTPYESATSSTAVSSETASLKSRDSPSLDSSTPTLQSGDSGYWMAAIRLNDAPLSSAAPTQNALQRRKSWVRLPKVLHGLSGEAIGQVAFFLSISSFLLLILYYEMTSHPTPFESFMNSQSMGVRALFASLGLVASLFWDDCFDKVATKEPYRLLSFDSETHTNPKTVSYFLETPPPTTAFGAFKPTRLSKTPKNSLLVQAVAFTTVLSKFTPPLLSNIPFSPWLTWTTHQACAWSTVAILIIMLLTLGYLLVAVRYPYMPVYPGTLGATMHYVCDSQLLVSSSSSGGHNTNTKKGNDNDEDETKAANEAAKKKEKKERWGAYTEQCPFFGRMIGQETGEVRVGIGSYDRNYYRSERKPS